jgi:hypothetical protein
LSDDIIERLSISLHLPVRELRAHLAETIPLAVSEIRLLRERESLRDTLPTPAAVSPAAIGRARLYGRLGR